MTQPNVQGSQESLKRLAHILKRVSQRTSTSSTTAPSTATATSIGTKTPHRRSSGSPEDLEVRQNAIKVAKLLFVGSILTTGPKKLDLRNTRSALNESRTSSSNSSSTLISEQGEFIDPPVVQQDQVQLRHKKSAVDGLKSGKSSLLTRYNKLEDQIIDSLESFTSVIDNFIFMSSIFKLNTKFKVLGRLLRFLSQIWVFITIINLKNLILKLLQVNRIIKMVNFQIMAINNKMSLAQNALIEYTYDLEVKLIVLKNEKFKLILELIGNLNELLMFLVEIYSIKLPSVLNNSINLMSWGMSMYRVSKDSSDEESSEEVGTATTSAAATSTSTVGDNPIKRPGFTVDEIINEYSL